MFTTSAPDLQYSTRIFFHPYHLQINEWRILKQQKVAEEKWSWVGSIKLCWELLHWYILIRQYNALILDNWTILAAKFLWDKWHALSFWQHPEMVKVYISVLLPIFSSISIKIFRLFRDRTWLIHRDCNTHSVLNWTQSAF